MAFGRHQGDDAPLSEINVTPLVDVMLVLLVIFIICAPLMAQALKVDLPKTGGTPLAEVDRLTVEISAHGIVRIDGTPVSETTLAAITTDRLHAAPDTVVEIAADASVSYGVVAKTLSRLRRAGADRLAFTTQPE